MKITNEELIAKYRDWRSRWHPIDDQIEEEITLYLSRLAEYISPVPLSKVTKAVMQISTLTKICA